MGEPYDCVADMSPDQQLWFYIEDTRRECSSISGCQNKYGVEPELWKSICDFDKEADSNTEITLEQMRVVRSQINVWLRKEFDRRDEEWKKEFGTTCPYTRSRLVIPL